MKNVFATFAALAMLCSGCENNSDLAGNPIDSNIIIQTREVLEPGSRKLTLFCQTERIYGCSNFQIKSAVSTNQSGFSIAFINIEKSSTCATSLGPATTTIDLNSIQNGEYPIKIDNGNLHNTGLLRITDESLDLVFNHLNGIRLEYATTRRVPTHTYWGHIGYHTGTSINLANSFIQKLEDHGAVFGDQVPGHYFYYDIDANGDIITPDNLGYYFVKSFIFQFDGDEAILKHLVSVDGNELKSSLSIRMETYRGEQINNWDN